MVAHSRTFRAHAPRPGLQGGGVRWIASPSDASAPAPSASPLAAPPPPRCTVVSVPSHGPPCQPSSQCASASRIRPTRKKPQRLTLRNLRELCSRGRRGRASICPCSTALPLPMVQRPQGGCETTTLAVQFRPRHQRKGQLLPYVISSPAAALSTELMRRRLCSKEPSAAFFTTRAFGLASLPVFAFAAYRIFALKTTFGFRP